MTGISKLINRNFIGLILGIITCAGIIIFTDLKPGYPQMTYALAVTSLMAIWWITEALPLAVTALVPIVLFPLFGIIDGRDISSVYLNDIIFLFIGGFIMALAMEKWNLHKRIALKILIIIGVSPGRILLGFMLSTFFLSMWISNTATTMMMIPIVLSVIIGLEKIIGKTEIINFSTGLILGIAYSSSIGGMATLVGSPTNLICPKMLTMLFPHAPQISFANWFFMALPISVTMFIFAWILLFFIYKPKKNWEGISSDTFRKQYMELGLKTMEEKIVFSLFILLVFLWIFRADIVIGNFKIPGWSNILNYPKFINDGTIAIGIALIFFIIPSQSMPGTKLMDWKTANKLPWNIVLLFGGGFALAMGFEKTGLSIWFGEQLSWTKGINVYLIILAIVTMMSLLTELTSNVASTQMLLPVFASLAVSSGNNPLLLMIPVTFASSLAFMLPTATPPNAIIFGTDRITIPQMVRTGFLLNIIGILLILLFTMLSGGNIFDAKPGILPEWALMKTP